MLSSCVDPTYAQTFASKIPRSCCLDAPTAGESTTLYDSRCADSVVDRLSEGTLFHTAPGVVFAERNIAAQYYEDDKNGSVSSSPWTGPYLTLLSQKCGTCIRYGSSGCAQYHCHGPLWMRRRSSRRNLCCKLGERRSQGRHGSMDLAHQRYLLELEEVCHSGPLFC